MNNFEIIHLLKGRANVYLLKQDERCLLIDSGTIRYKERVLLALKDRDIHPGQIDYIILTHTHADHAGSAGILKKITGARIIMHHKEMDWVKNGIHPIPTGTTLVTSLLSDFANSFLKKIGKFPSFEPDILIFDKLDLNELGWNGYIMHTPGHSPGSLSVIIKNKYAFVGDTLFGIFPNSVFPPFSEKMDLLMESWERLIGTGCSFFYPGHGRCINYNLLLKNYNTLKTKIKTRSIHYVSINS